MATYPAPYLTQQMLTDAWGAEAMRQCFDDTNTNTVNTAGVASVISRAQAQTTSWLGNTYTGALPFPAPVPELIVECAFGYAWFFAVQRNPDYLRALGVDLDKLWKRTEALGLQIQEAIKRLIDAPAPAPTNVGGDVESNDANDGFAPKPLFFVGGMGDF